MDIDYRVFRPPSVNFLSRVAEPRRHTGRKKCLKRRLGAGEYPPLRKKFWGQAKKETTGDRVIVYAKIRQSVECQFCIDLLFESARELSGVREGKLKTTIYPEHD